MDTNWCAVCGKHIDFSDTDLYCSEKCRADDELPNLTYTSTFTIASPNSSITPSPTLTYSFVTHGQSKVSPSPITIGSHPFKSNGGYFVSKPNTKSNYSISPP